MRTLISTSLVGAFSLLALHSPRESPAPTPHTPYSMSIVEINPQNRVLVHRFRNSARMLAAREDSIFLHHMQSSR
jgi:hypothetical protein